MTIILAKIQVSKVFITEQGGMALKFPTRLSYMKKLLQAELLLLDTLDTRTPAANLSGEAVGTSPESVWLQDSACAQRPRAVLWR